MRLLSNLSVLAFVVSVNNNAVIPSYALAAPGGKGVGMPPLSITQGGIHKHVPLAKKALNYFDSSPDPFHAVQTSIDILQEAGFSEIKEDVPYQDQLEQGGKYYFTKNRSSIVAFAVGDKFNVANGGFKVIGGHTDSPNLKVKPRSKRGGSGFIQLAVECYGGGLWHTWFDRDLGISGRVLARGPNGSIEQKLIMMDRALLRIPTLAIHLQTAKEREAFAMNKEDELVPILAREVKKALEGNQEDDDNKEESAMEYLPQDDGWVEHQEPILLQMIAAELDMDVKDIVDFELNLFDVQKASLGGAFSEFIHSARLDNLASCFMAIQSLVEYTSEALDDDEDISLVALFDHEEIGSTSATGAGSTMMGDAVERICSAFIEQDNVPFVDTMAGAKSRSMILSVDQAHAIHPNYARKHEKAHAPKMNDGMVIKRNSNQRYATTAITGLIIREIARKAGLAPVQEFVVRNDCGCGSTIGPVISSLTGIKAIDMGCPQLSMHSIRESMGTCDVTNGLELFKAFFTHFKTVQSSIED